jgi:ABC-2 type transport system ATP-binding protein
LNRAVADDTVPEPTRAFHRRALSKETPRSANTNRMKQSSPMADQTLFELEKVRKTYGSVTALDQVSLRMPPGAIGLLGPNGAGKTTLIRTLLGLIRIDSGGGTVMGLDIHARRLDIRQACGLMPEDECLFPALVGVEFVAYGGELAGMAPRPAMQRAHEVLDYVGLGEARYRRVESYSTGMKQRLKLASAIVHDPRLLILDEPTNGMDPRGRDEVLELARDLSRQKGMSLLYSSHLLPDVESVCDYCVVLGRGQVLAAGSIAELKAPHQRGYVLRVRDDADGFGRRLQEFGCRVEPQNDVTQIELPPEKTVAAVWELASQSGHQIRFLRPQRSTLEEVFLKAVREQS